MLKTYFVCGSKAILRGWDLWKDVEDLYFFVIGEVFDQGTLTEREGSVLLTS
jgi:hypothetical protein